MLGRWQLLYDVCWGRELVERLPLSHCMCLYCTNPVHPRREEQYSFTKHSSAQLSSAVWRASCCTEEAVYIEIVTSGPEAPVKARWGQGLREQREYRKSENYGGAFELLRRLKQSFDQAKGLMGQRSSGRGCRVRKTAEEAGWEKGVKGERGSLG